MKSGRERAEQDCTQHQCHGLHASVDLMRYAQGSYENEPAANACGGPNREFFDEPNGRVRIRRPDVCDRCHYGNHQGDARRIIEARLSF
jgi:hypothetical protein